jgi:hypothetical protein
VEIPLRRKLFLFDPRTSSITPGIAVSTRKGGFRFVWGFCRRYRWLGALQRFQSCLKLIMQVTPAAVRPSIRHLTRIRTLANEEPDITVIALRPGIVDTDVCVLTFSTLQQKGN